MGHINFSYAEPLNNFLCLPVIPRIGCVGLPNLNISCVYPPSRGLMTLRSVLALTSQPSLTAASTAVSESDAESASVQEGATV